MTAIGAPCVYVHCQFGRLFDLAADGLDHPPRMAVWSAYDRTAIKAAATALRHVAAYDGCVPLADFDAMAASVAAARRRVAARDPALWPALRPRWGGPGDDLSAPILWAVEPLLLALPGSQDLTRHDRDRITRAAAGAAVALRIALTIAGDGGPAACEDRASSRALFALLKVLPPAAPAAAPVPSGLLHGLSPPPGVIMASRQRQAGGIGAA